jgi:ankyrin repeat protein
MSEQRGPEPSERIDEILQLLFENGLATSDELEEAIKEATAIKAAYTVDCLIQLRERLCVDAPLDTREETAAHLKVRADGRRTFEAKIAAGELLSPNEFWKAMKERFFDTVLNGMSPASSVLPMAYRASGNPLQFFVDGGYSSMLGRVANSEYVAKHDEGTWADTGKCVDPEKLLPLLTIACRREIPNMDVIKVLVETFGVDVNGGNRAVPQPRSQRDEDTGSPLHALALGGHWWQAAEGIPYLVAHGANVNKRDVNGRTPLNAVVERVRHSKMWLRRKVVEVLLAHGADVNSVGEGGKSCLEYAMSDPETYELLLKHSKQTPSCRNLISAITDGKVDMVESLLEAGVDPNGRKVPAIESFDCDRYGARVLNFCDYEKFPLHHALTCDNSVLVKQEMGELLLKFGADPLARYEKSTLLHEVFSQRYRNVMRWLLDKE